MDRVAKAVADAEKGISGEIVVVVAPASDTYPDGVWEGAVYGFALGAGLLIAIELFRPLLYPLAALLSAPVACGGAGFLLARWCPPAIRLLAGAARMDEMARRGAAEAFLAKEVFRTRERTGILIYVSLFERRVVVLGDSGINAKVGKDEWDGVVATVSRALHEGRMTDALIEGVRSCRSILERAGFAARPDDTNELPDRPRN
ncbi:MAG: hypothetical protein HY553_12275 [Elusimicrobia bacterium]|nr:hypothetical protein [Elusimicrobiota bacterium]